METFYLIAGLLITCKVHGAREPAKVPNEPENHPVDVVRKPDKVKFEPDRRGWPSDHHDNMIPPYLEKYVVGYETVVRVECRSPETGQYWGYYDSFDGSELSIGGLVYAAAPDTECREARSGRPIYVQCDEEADEFAGLCTDGGPNVTHLARGGSSWQGCGTSDWAADYFNNPDTTIDRLVRSGLCGGSTVPDGWAVPV